MRCPGFAAVAARILRRRESGGPTRIMPVAPACSRRRRECGASWSESASATTPLEEGRLGVPQPGRAKKRHNTAGRPSEQGPGRRCRRSTRFRSRVFAVSQPRFRSFAAAFSRFRSRAGAEATPTPGECQRPMRSLAVQQRGDARWPHSAATSRRIDKANVRGRTRRRQDGKSTKLMCVAALGDDEPAVRAPPKPVTA